MGGKNNWREYIGANHMRQRLILATITSTPVKIRNIRSREDDPGVVEAEAGFIRLLDKLTNGSKIEVNETGTQLSYQPGALLGGRVEHSCSLTRGIGYWLEPILALAPFCKEPLHLILTGVTNNQIDPSPDWIKASCLPVLKRFLLDDSGLELTVSKRGAAPGGGGQVVLKCPVKKALRPVQVTEQGKIKRVRGVAWAVRVSPSTANRVVETAKGVLLKYLPDVYIYTDHFTGAKSGNSPGFGLTLTAETTTGNFLTAEVCSNPAGGGQGPTVPEELGVAGAKALLEEIFRGGCADSLTQSLTATLMGLGPADVNKFVTGPLSPYTVQCLRHLKDFLQLVFKLETHRPLEEEGGDEELKLGAAKVLLTCVGVGFTNMSKRTA